ncbi:Abi-alpha family protein [Ensifer sp. ZNC0028]|uniref:Abi-alpha family protein n=1 Tax=Ensifer sp. ZNC0028 TaxID=1339236 RepID=UPI0005BB22C3|nr:Abi-alpha family protein [Ensifer sp. ZNC0028]
MDNPEAEALKEASKAVQEVAKTASDYKDLVGDAGGFFGKIFGPAATEAGLWVRDYLHGRRIELAIRQRDRVEQLLNERGITSIRPLPLAEGIPLIDAATLEEDPVLSEMFANLIISFVDADRADYLPRTFIDVLKRMSPFEAIILKKMIDAPASALTESGMMYATRLPDVFLAAPAPQDTNVPDPPSSVVLALASLETLGCIDGAALWDGGTTYRQVRVTDYGRALMTACLPVI